MTLSINIAGRLGTFSLEAHIEAGEGITALMGPSGAGKSSILRAVCGLWRPDSGRIVLNGRSLFDRSNDVDVPTHRRNLGVVFQQPLLFPHMSVARNLAYGAKGDGISLDEVCDLLDIGDLLQRMPRNLSGGEAQRVAIGRALMSAPEMLLLDEPLTALDEARRAAVLPYLTRLQETTGMPMLYVSHRRDEVEFLADRVVMVQKGRSGTVLTRKEFAALPPAGPGGE